MTLVRQRKTVLKLETVKQVWKCRIWSHMTDAADAEQMQIWSSCEEWNWECLGACWSQEGPVCRFCTFKIFLYQDLLSHCDNVLESWESREDCGNQAIFLVQFPVGTLLQCRTAPFYESLCLLSSRQKVGSGGDGDFARPNLMASRYIFNFILIFILILSIFFVAKMWLIGFSLRYWKQRSKKLSHVDKV